MSDEKNIKFISLQEASKSSPYSQEYLRLLARQGKIVSKRIGRNWFTTETAVKDYIAKQSLTLVIPRSILNAANPELEIGSQIRIGKGPETQESALFISTPDTGAIQKTEQTLETISDNIRQLSSLQDLQFKKIQEMELQQLRARDDAKIGSHVGDALARISENLEQLSSVHDLQLRQMEIQQATVASHVATASELGTIQKMQSAVHTTSEKTEKLLEKIHAGLAQYTSPQSAQTVELTGAQIRQSLDNITENLKQLSLVQDIQLKQIQLQQQSIEEAVRTRNHDGQLSAQLNSQVEHVAQVANQEFLSQRTDAILEKIYMAVDRMVHSQEIQTMKPVAPTVAIASIADQEHQTKVATALEKITENLETIQKTQQEQAEILRAPVSYEAEPVAQLTEQQQEVIAVESESLTYKIKRFNYRGKHYFNFSRKTYGLLISSIVLIFLMMGGASFGNIDTAARVVKDFFKNADALQGHFPGTHANEVLLLDHAGNVSIYGHIETQGQLRSFAPDGVAPITVDSKVLVENLNAEYLDGLASKDFTLAFVTKNGNVTHDNVFLEGKVEVGKTLTVKGATNLLNSLSVDGGITVRTGNVGILDGSVIVDRGDINAVNGNLVLDKGTIKINDPHLIKNLNADFLDDFNAKDFTLDQVIGFGNVARRVAFFNAGLWGENGSFGSLGVAGNASIGNAEDFHDLTFTVYSKRFRLDDNGNLTASGKASVGKLAVTGTVESHLVASGSYNLGSLSSPWNNLFVNTITLDSASSSYFYASPATASSPSFSFAADKDTGIFSPASNSIAFSNFGSESFRINAKGFVGIGTTAPKTKLEVQGTTSASYGLFGALQVAGFSSASYSRYGTNTTSHSLSAASDLLVSGSFELDGELFIDGSSNLTGVASAASYYAQGRNAASPSFSFTTDRDTGLFSPAANVVGLSTGATERFRIDSNGRVGINTTAPSTLFEVQGTVSGSYGLFGTLQVGGFSSVSYNRLGTTATTHSNYISANNDLLISGDLEVRSSFSVGGPASISGPLRLTATPDASATGFALQLGGTLSGGDSSGTYVALNAPSSFNGVLAHIQKNGSDYFKIINNGSTELLQLTATNYVNSSQYQIGSSTVLESTSGLLRFATSSGWTALQFNTSGSERLRIDSSGFVGIGTAAPATKLEVQGTASASYFLTGNTIQAGGYSSAAYNRFGTATTTHANYITTTNDVLVSGDLEVDASAAFDSHVAIGNATDGTDLVTVNAQIQSHLIPFNNGYDIGSSANRWRKIYVDSADITNLTAASASISGTVASDFTINSDNATADTENASVTFERGTPTTNAVFNWDATNDRFGFNFPVFMQTSNPSQTSTNFTKLTLKGATNQAANDYFEIQNVDGSRLFFVETGGSVAASGSLQVGSTSTASYSRFGTATTTHSGTVTASNDLLISGDLEIDGNAYFDGTTNLGTASASLFYAGNGTAASPSFSFRADQDTGMYRPTTNQLGFSTLGSERIRIDDSGRVGIGTTTPSSLLTVQGRGEFQGTASASYLLTGNTLQVGGFATVAYSRFGTAATNYTNFITTTNDVLISGDLEIDATAQFDGNLRVGSGVFPNLFVENGNAVGILTSTPDADLDVQGTILASASDNVAVTIRSSSATGNDQGLFSLRSAGANERLDIINNTTERVTIASAGNVGIGTTAPSALLHVKHTTSGAQGKALGLIENDANGVGTYDLVKIQGGLDNGTVNLFKIQQGDTSGGTGGGYLIKVLGDNEGDGTNTDLNELFSIKTGGSGSASRTYFMGNVGIGTLSPATVFDIRASVSGGSDLLNVASSSGTHYLRVTKAGNVGIGTTTPSSLLTVQGRGEFQGTASASYLLTGNTLQVGGYSSVAYSRFGTSTTTHSNWISSVDDLFLTSDLEGRGSISFAGPASFSNAFRVNPGTKQVLINTNNLSQSTAQLIVNGGLLITASADNGNGARGITLTPDIFSGEQYIRARGNSGGRFNIVGYSTGSGTDLTAIRLSVGSNVSSISFETAAVGATAPTERMRITSSGFIGIGTSAPTTKLEVQGTASASYFLTGNTIQVGGFSSVAYNRFGTSTTTHSNFISNNDDVLVSGDLEVRSSLSIVGPASISSFLFTDPTNSKTTVGRIDGSAGAFLNVVGNTVNAALFLQAAADSSSDHQVRFIRSRGTVNSPTALQSGDPVGAISFRPFRTGTTYTEIARIVGVVNGTPTSTTVPVDLALYTGISAAVERMRITSNGNIGIGTASPDSILEAASASAKFIVRSTGSTASASIAFLPAGGSSVSNEGMFTIRAGGLASTNGERLDFINGNNVNLVTIASIGNVGIGTTTPSSLLTVQGRGEFQGTASASYLLTGNTLQVGGYSSVAYSRFGTSTTAHSNFITTTNDVLISGDLEVRGSVAFAGPASISGQLNVVGSVAPLVVRVAGANGAIPTLSGTETALFMRNTGAAASTYSSVAIIGGDGTGASEIEFGGSTTVNQGLIHYDFTGSDYLSFNVNSSERFRVDGARGFFGINTTAPSTKLEVQGTASASYLLTGNTLQVGGYTSVAYNRFGTTSTTHSNYISASNDVLISGDLEGLGSLSFAGPASLSNSLFIQSGAGNVGIGTTNPTYNLHILKNGDSGIFLEADADNVTETDNAFIKFSQDGATVQSILGTIGSAGTDPEGNTFTGALQNGTLLGTTTTEALQLGTSDNVRLTITSTGNIGIATATPTTLFEVQGTASASYFLTGNTLQVGGFSSAAYNRFGTNTTTQSHYITTTNDVLVSGDLEVDGSASFAGPASISGTLYIGTMGKSGNVGIGTRTPADTLVVGGTTDFRTAANVDTANRGLTIVPATDNADQTIRAHGSSNNLVLEGFQTANASTPARLKVNTAGFISFETNPSGSTATERMRITSQGFVGVGTTTPKSAFMIRDTLSGSSASGSFAILSSNITGVVASISATSLTTGSVISIRVAPSSSFQGPILVAKDTANLVLASLSSGGRFSLRREIFSHGATSNCTGVGAPVAGCLDYAEDFPVDDPAVEAGDLVAINASKSPTIIKSTNGHTTIGIVSTKPGVVVGKTVRSGVTAGEKEDGYLPVALSGRVPVKVSLENGPIKVGDRLTLSSKPGIAMKAMQAGMTVGIALEDVSEITADSYSKVLTFVNLDWYGGDLASLEKTADQNQPSISQSTTNTTIIQQIGSMLDSLWVKKDIVAQGIQKTYYAISSIELFKNFDIATMAANWLKRPVMLGNDTPEKENSIFSGASAQAADQSKLDLKNENGNYLATYGVDSTRGEITLSGSSEIQGGEAQIFFDFSFTSVISNKTPIRVIITPTSATVGQLYVAQKTAYGFVVKQANSGERVTFDWLVVARRKGYEDPAIEGAQSTPIPTPAPEPTPEPAGGPTPEPEEVAPTLTPTPTPPPAGEPTPTETPANTSENIEPTPIPVEIAPTPIPEATPEPTPEPVQPTPTPIPETGESTPTPTETPQEVQ